MRSQAIFFLFLVAAQHVTRGQAVNSESLMDRAENVVRQRVEQLTDDYIKELEVLAQLYKQSGDLLGTAAADAELTRVKQFGHTTAPNPNQLPAGIAALEADYKRHVNEETIRVLRPLVVHRREEIAERKRKSDFATAMIMEKELDGVCQRFGWQTKQINLESANVPQHPGPKYPVAARREHLTGKGLFLLEIDTISGAVTDVTVSKSTGHTILDEAAISALRKWRFAPHSMLEVSVPITFSMDSRSATPAGKH